MAAPVDGEAAVLAALPSLVDLLRYRAAEQAGDPAYILLSDRGREETRITFGELERRSRSVAAQLAERAAPGERALLLFPNGIDFMVAFFGCLVAGIIAVPMMLPRRQSARDSSDSIVADCAPRLGLATTALLAGGRGDIAGRFGDLDWLAVDQIAADSEVPDTAFPPVAAADIAFLQYTSGSTSDPKGVMVSHANLIANLAMMREAFGNSRASTYVSWTPLYHDMGLIINALESLYSGALCVLQSPVAFVQRPLLWLRAISDYRAEVAVGPNFAFDLCVDRYRPEDMADLDLSCWKLALNASEPVRADTIGRFATTFAPHGFDASAMYPAYGMAEATVLISAGKRSAGPVIGPVSRDGLQQNAVMPPSGEADRQEVVGCGRAFPGERVVIANPVSLRRLDAGRIGEIWAAGPNIAPGYWRNPEATAEAFMARLAGEADETQWLRTGDLGFLDAAGELFITGRIKEIVIIRGVNHYPQDIEHTVQRSHPALRRHGGAAFAVVDPAGAERLVIVQEVERTYRNRIDPAEIVARVREAVVTEHEVAPHEIALLRPGALPKTTSGKIQRAVSRQLWQQGALDFL
ncbi:MAG TPA: fatty acyl-AMP ligase [Stellaceae bacterium]|nr:fatty acyl-AMP ligase [Stellaceae bacterium]